RGKPYSLEWRMHTISIFSIIDILLPSSSSAFHLFTRLLPSSFPSSVSLLGMSWNGRERARTKGSFAFGSSTPRDLSYMNKVPCKMRVYNVKAEPLDRRDDPPLSQFVKMAHTTIHSDSSSSSGKVAFGSGTPRQFLHLCQIPSSLRVYDAPLLSSRPVTRSITMPPKNRELMVDPMEMDDVSSEPDLVTDRLELIPKRIKTMGGMRRSEERRVSGVKEETKELPSEDKRIHRAKENDHPPIEGNGVSAVVPIQNDAVSVLEMIEDEEISREGEEIRENKGEEIRREKEEHEGGEETDINCHIDSHN
ncbi:hypothetical protein PENTCL1PPCAC_11460, partial [Pristionchus entomophagus]